MHRGFAVLLDWTDASALPKEALTKLKTPSTFPTESFPVLFPFVQSTFSVEEALRAEEKWIVVKNGLG